MCIRDRTGHGGAFGTGTGRLLRTEPAICESAACATGTVFRPTDGRKTDLMMVGQPSPNQTTINNLTENQTMGASGEPPAAFGRYQNIFLSQTEYDELQAEYPDRLERFI